MGVAVREVGGKGVGGVPCEQQSEEQVDRHGEGAEEQHQPPVDRDRLAAKPAEKPRGRLAEEGRGEDPQGEQTEEGAQDLGPHQSEGVGGRGRGAGAHGGQQSQAEAGGVLYG